MDHAGKRKNLWLPILTGLSAGILLLLLILSIGIFRAGHTLKQYEDRLDTIVSRMETATEELEELDLQGLVATVNGLTQDMDRTEIVDTIHSLHEITDQLSQVEWAEMSESITAAAVQAKESLAGIEQTMAEMEAAVDKMDIDALNKAVTDMKDAIAPLAALNNALFNKD